MQRTIAIDIRALGTGRTSGVEEYTRQLLSHMLSLDEGVRFKLLYAGRTPLERQPWMDRPNVSIYESGRSNRMLLASTRLFGRPCLDRLVDGADAFFFPHFLDGATSPSCRRVLTFHDLSFERFAEFFSTGRRLWHTIQMRPRRQAHRADHIIAVSESTKQDLVSLYGIAPSGITTIHSGVDPVLARISEAECERFRREKNLPERFILALGTIEPRKNLVTVIRALEMLPASQADVGLVIAGPRGWLWRETVKAVEGSSVSGRIRFVDDIRPEERSVWLSSASVLAYPSFFEGFGFPPLEAMACGTSVLIGANSSMLQVCGSAVVAVQPYSVTQVRDGLSALLGDSVLRERCIRRGYDRVRGFSWQTAAQKTLETILSTFS